MESGDRAILERVQDVLKSLRADHLRGVEDDQISKEGADILFRTAVDIVKISIQAYPQKDPRE